MPRGAENVVTPLAILMKILNNLTTEPFLTRRRINNFITCVKNLTAKNTSRRKVQPQPKRALI